MGFIAGLLWGSRAGVQFSLTLVVLKAMPVLIIGGFDSIEGAIVGGLIVGASEKLAEVYVGPILGAGIENCEDSNRCAACRFLAIRGFRAGTVRQRSPLLLG